MEVEFQKNETCYDILHTRVNTKKMQTFHIFRVDSTQQTLNKLWLLLLCKPNYCGISPISLITRNSLLKVFHGDLKVFPGTCLRHSNCTFLLRLWTHGHRSPTSALLQLNPLSLRVSLLAMGQGPPISFLQHSKTHTREYKLCSHKLKSIKMQLSL